MKSLSEVLTDTKTLADKIETLLIESDGEINDELSKLLEFKAEQASEVAHTVDIQCITIERLNAVTSFYEDQVRGLNRIIAGLKKAEEHIKSHLLIDMETRGVAAISGNQRMIKIKNNPPKVDILDSIEVPAEFIRVKITEEPDKKKISAFLKEGGQLEWARLIQTRSLSIAMAKPQRGVQDGN